MLRIIVLSLIWGVLSTSLVRPQFWIGLLKKDLEKMGFDKNWKSGVILEIILFIGNIIISLIMYCGFGTMLNFIGSLPMIMFCIFAQSIHSKHFGIFLIMFIICTIIGAYEIDATNSICMPNMDVELTISYISHQATDVNVMISPDIIQTLFGASNVKGPYHNNGKYIFVLQGGNLGDGVVVIEENDNIGHFISVSYSPEVRTIRDKYPCTKLKVLDIYVTDNQKPYALFAIAKKNWFDLSYRVDGFLLLNLKDGVIQEYSLEDYTKLQDMKFTETIS